MANDTNRVIVELGTVIKNRNNYSDQARYFKDNVVQYEGGSYIAQPTSSVNDGVLDGKYYLTRAPFTTNPQTPNAGWSIFATGKHNFASGEDIEDISIATNADFVNPDSTSRAKVPTVGTMLDGMNDGIYDVSSRYPTGGPNNDGVFTLEYILSNANTLIPSAWRKGGMSIRFVQNNDNNSTRYVQYRYMGTSTAVADFTNVANWQGVDDEPNVGSKNLVTSGGVTEFVGLPVEILKIEVADAYKSKVGSVEMKAGITYKFIATTSNNSNAAINIASGSSFYSQGTIYLSLTFKSGTPGVGTYTPEEDITANVLCGNNGHIYDLVVTASTSINKVVWTTAQSLTDAEKTQVLNNLGLDTLINGLNTAVDAKLSNKLYRGSAKIAHCSSINFDNTNHKVVLNNVFIANPNNNTRLTIDAQEVEYTFSASITTAWWFVYDVSNSTYAFKSAGTTSINDVVIACIFITGAGTTNGKVTAVTWCAIENWSIDNESTNTRLAALDESVDDLEEEISDVRGLLEVDLITAELTLATGSIYNGQTNADSVCLNNSNYIPVSGGTTIQCIYANDINIRVSEFSAPTGTSGFIRQTAYGQLETLTLQKNTKYVRVSANYSQRGFDSQNPVKVSDFQAGDFGFKYQEAEVIKNLQSQINTVATAPIEEYPNKSYFVDGSTWKSGSGVYACKVIPVVGDGKIICTANASVPTRIAFLNTFDEEYILANMPCAVDGTGNQNTSSGQTRIYDIPSTCTYIALNSKYSNVDSLPVSLIINGKEYMKNIPDAVVDLTNKVTTETNYNAQVDNLQVGTFTSIIGRNIHRDAAVRATGKKVVDADILPLSFIHISDIHTKTGNYKCFESACEFLEHYSNVKFMIATGDLVYDSYADPMTYYDTALKKTTKPVLNVIGNHDSGQQKATNPSLDRVCSDIQCYERYIAPYISAGTLDSGAVVPGWGAVQPSDAATAGKSYYYKDFTDEKIRLIVLNEFETDYEIDPNNANKLLYSREYRAMRQAQVDWLISTLGSTPNDYGVIVAYHQPGSYLNDTETNEFVSIDLVNRAIGNVYCDDKLWLEKILNAFATKSSLELTVTQTGAVVTSSATLVCDCDFTNVQAEFICILNGHTHKDYIGHNKIYPALTVLAVGADNLGYTSGFQPRQAGTPSEDLFNVVNIDRNRKTIKIIRIGSDASITGQVRDQMIMSYATT